VPSRLDRRWQILFHDRFGGAADVEVRSLGAGQIVLNTPSTARIIAFRPTSIALRQERGERAPLLLIALATAIPEPFDSG